jgi:hypothetical protein
MLAAFRERFVTGGEATTDEQEPIMKVDILPTQREQLASS